MGGGGGGAAGAPQRRRRRHVRGVRARAAARPGRGEPGHPAEAARGERPADPVHRGVPEQGPRHRLRAVPAYPAQKPHLFSHDCGCHTAQHTEGCRLTDTCTRAVLLSDS